MKIKFNRLHPEAVIPRYAHGPEEDAGMDLHAVGYYILLPNIPTLVKLGFSMELPPGYEAQIRPRSCLALKHGITVVNSPGTIDPGYRGEVGVILRLGPYGVFNERYEVKAFDRVAQMVIARYESLEFEESDSLKETERGSGGFGSTGL